LHIEYKSKLGRQDIGTVLSFACPYHTYTTDTYYYKQTAHYDKCIL